MAICAVVRFTKSLMMHPSYVVYVYLVYSDWFVVVCQGRGFRYCVFVCSAGLHEVST